MKRWFRARLFSVLWDLGDWAMRHALRLDDSEHFIDWKSEADASDPSDAWDPWVRWPPTTTNSVNCTTTRVTRFK